MIIIAIDCGASFMKGARYDPDTDSFQEVEIKKTPKSSKDQLRIDKTIQMIREMIDRLSHQGKEVHIGFSTEMHGFIIADKAGKALTDYISWKDECGNQMLGEKSYVEEVRYRLHEEEVLRTGMPIKAGLPSVNLFYYLQKKLLPLETSELYFYTLGDYIIKRLSGQEPLIHITNAAATGLFDLKEENWNQGILYKLGMQKIHFPSVTDRNQTILCESGARKIIFYPALGDQQAALLGSGFRGKNNISLNFGTGAQVSILKEDISLSNQYQTRPYFSNQYLNTIPHIPSGRALNVYFNFVKQMVNAFSDADDNDIWEFLLKETEVDPYGGSMKIDMSFFSNAVTKTFTGNIENIEEDKFTVGNLFHSIYRQMAVNAKQMADILSNDKYDTIYFSGGVVRKNRFLREFMLREFKMEKYVIAENETLKGICKFVMGKSEK